MLPEITIRQGQLRAHTPDARIRLFPRVAARAPSTKSPENLPSDRSEMEQIPTAPHPPRCNPKVRYTPSGRSGREPSPVQRSTRDPHVSILPGLPSMIRIRPNPHNQLHLQKHNEPNWNFPTVGHGSRPNPRTDRSRKFPDWHTIDRFQKEYDSPARMEYPLGASVRSWSGIGNGIADSRVLGLPKGKF